MSKFIVCKWNIMDRGGGEAYFAWFCENLDACVLAVTKEATHGAWEHMGLENNSRSAGEGGGGRGLKRPTIDAV